MTPPPPAPVSFLSGIKVLDLGRLMPSAMATFELAKMGADVVKVEIPPQGDYLRVNPPTIGGRGDMHLDINRSKRSLGLRFDTPAGRDVLLELAAGADVFVELSRPGVMERLGLDFESVRAVNEAVVYCSFSGYGQQGPYAPLAAHGLSADAASGFLPLADVDARLSLPEPYVSVGPRASGLYGAVGILGALFDARATGRAHHLDISQSDAAVAWNYRELAMTANLGHGVPSYRDLGPRYDVYECADGGYVLFAATEPKFWRAFCEAVGRDDLVDRATDALVDYHEDPVVRSSLVEIFATRDRAEWLELGARAGFPVAPVLRPQDVPDDPHLGSREMVVESPHPLGGDVLLSGHPVKFGAPPALRPAPELGEHSEQVLHDFGLDADRVAALRESELIEQAPPAATAAAAERGDRA